MSSYIQKWRQKIKSERIKDALFNRYYNIVDLYWNLFYALGFSIAAGIGNAFPYNSGFAGIVSLLLQGFLNNLPLSLFINIFYARIVRYFLSTRYPRMHANLLNVFINILFFIWHTLKGTENPLQAVAIPLIVGFLLTNFHVARESRQT